MMKKLVLVFVLSASCGRSEEKIAPQQHLAVDYSREAREEMQNGLFSDLPNGLEDYDILGWQRSDLPQIAEYSLLRFPDAADRDSVIDFTRRRGFRPANMDELLAYSRENLRGNFQSPIFAVGTVWKNRTFYPYVPYVYRSSGGLGLGLWFAWDKLPSDARFLSIKVSDNQAN
ncbi:hypothetical protein HYT45_01455 [Candidatus Uhrbacteria bacterium]|nr:hypothetical protein [Candidatus Uhrbacteria bacterium]